MLFRSWYNAVLRGDINRIVIGDHTNIQDNAVVHLADDFACEIGSWVTVGHSAIVHACTVGDECLVGMGAVILDGAVVGNQVEGNMKADTSYEIRVRLDDGTLRTFHQHSVPQWRTGERVRIVAHIGGAEVSSVAIALQSAMVDQVIALRTPEGRQTVRGRAVGHGEVEAVDVR